MTIEKTTIPTCSQCGAECLRTMGGVCCACHGAGDYCTSAELEQAAAGRSVIADMERRRSGLVSASGEPATVEEEDD